MPDLVNGGSVIISGKIGSESLNACKVFLRDRFGSKDCSESPDVFIQKIFARKCANGNEEPAAIHIEIMYDYNGWREEANAWQAKVVN